MIIELKVENSKNNGRGDNPTVALLEGLRYTAIVQANQKAIADEVERRFEVKVTEGPPIVQILASEDCGAVGCSLAKVRAPPEIGRRNMRSSPETLKNRSALPLSARRWTLNVPSLNQ